MNIEQLISLAIDEKDAKRLHDLEMKYLNLVKTIPPKKLISLNIAKVTKLLPEFEEAYPEETWMRRWIELFSTGKGPDDAYRGHSFEKYEHTLLYDQLGTYSQAIRYLAAAHGLFISGKPKPSQEFSARCSRVIRVLYLDKYWIKHSPESWHLSKTTEFIPEEEYQIIKDFIHSTKYRNYRKALWLDLFNELESLSTDT